MKTSIHLSPKTYRVFALLAISARTKSELAQLAGLTRATVGHCVAHLVRLNLAAISGKHFYITDHGIDHLNSSE